MEISLAFLAFFAVLSLLILAYALNFRRRALVMGGEHLRAALSRAVTGEEGAGREELLAGARELDARLRRAFVAVTVLLISVLASCAALTFTSTLPELSLALSGACIFLVAAAVSISLLRDIPRAAVSGLEREGGGKQRDAARS